VAVVGMWRQWRAENDQFLSRLVKKEWWCDICAALAEEREEHRLASGSVISAGSFYLNRISK
jgi:hypothetical protein